MALLELEPALWRELGLGFVELVCQLLERLRVGALVVGGDVVGGVGDFVGEPGDAG